MVEFGADTVGTDWFQCFNKSVSFIESLDLVNGYCVKKAAIPPQSRENQNKKGALGGSKRFSFL